MVLESCFDPFDFRYKDTCRGGLWETRYYYDRLSKSCEMFWYDGCKRKSRNIFTDLESCQWLCEGAHPKPEARKLRIFEYKSRKFAAKQL